MSMTSADVRRHGAGSEPKGLAIVDCGSVEIPQRQPHSCASRVIGGVVGTQTDRLVEIGQRLGIGASVGAGICTIAVGKSLLVGRVVAGNDLRAGSQAQLRVTNLIAVGNGVRLCTTNAAQDNDAAKDNCSHASASVGSLPHISSNEGVQCSAIPKGWKF